MNYIDDRHYTEMQDQLSAEALGFDPLTCYGCDKAQRRPGLCAECEAIREAVERGRRERDLKWFRHQTQLEMRGTA